MPLEKLHHLAKRYEHYKGIASESYLHAAHVFQRDTDSEYEAMLYNPFICIILQGRKEVHIGQNSVSLVPNDALLVSHDLPVTAKIFEASQAAPYRSLVFALDMGLLRSLYDQVGEMFQNEASASALAATPADPSFIAPMVRYLELMDAPLDAQILGPMIVKEIHFRLLMSPIGGMLRNLLSVDSHASRIARSINKIRSSFREPLIVAELAEIAGMSPSSFHEHFKSVTGTTPLQYQKDLRLIEAREILLKGTPSVSAAGFEVGYESPTHFSRDYSRKFGCSPKHHRALAK
ncbi:AraC family transcriptional regulator [Falsiruegeria litorea]|uniref:AraC family transcriptional regulator n=1 Tax=Falsiruegeria litorea TaxID=1280831 RepID=A0ABS5WRK9_9RHOB|nr:AraC family transcriptional regulator [Falsiruegeria litorea]MBT3141361.1 AraC family transcriptional regulator [Falsiruegeria litorea]MBT8171239.1 AraC family transcriptional regulator [Falsiruegeria litorea]